MTEKALAAVNDSKTALNAFLEALRLSRRFGFRLGAVCVAPSYEGDLALVGVHELKRTLSGPSRSVLEEAVRIAAEEGLGLATFRAEGSRHEAIIELAVMEKYDLIIIGQPPRIRWSSLGSLTAGLLRHSPVDLLVIPEGQSVRLDRVLHVLGGFQPPSTSSKPMTSSVGKKGAAFLRREANAVARPSPAMEEGCARFGQAAAPVWEPAFLPGTEAYQVFAAGHSPGKICEMARKIGVDLIVCEDRGPRRGGWVAFAGTKAFRIVCRSSRPVWIRKA